MRRAPLNTYIIYGQDYHGENDCTCGSEKRLLRSDAQLFCDWRYVGKKLPEKQLKRGRGHFKDLRVK